MPLIINQGDNLPAGAVTDAMIEAGRDAYVAACFITGTEEMLASIYLAMNAACTPDTETLSASDRELIERLRDQLLETQMLAFKWMEAHDKLHSGKPYEFPKPAYLPDALKENARLEALLSTRDDAPDARPDVDGLDWLLGPQPKGEVEAMREQLAFVAKTLVRQDITAKGRLAILESKLLAPKERSE